jgi:NAD(P)-dependent dehydrogenase (short-subunit alcohol dehydrogenase family)
VIIADLVAPAELVPNSTFVETDVSSWASLLKVFKTAGHVDILIANAGVLGSANWLDDSVDEAGDLARPDLSVLGINTGGVVMSIKLAVSYMRQQKSGGSIVITASGIIYDPPAVHTLYTASKMAVSVPYCY